MNLRFIWAFARFNGISWLKRSPQNFLTYIVTAMALLFIIYFLSNGKLVDFAVVGGVVSIIAAGSLTTTGQSALLRLEFKIQDLIIATRASITEYIAGFAIANFVFSIPGIIFFTLLTAAFGLFTPLRFATTVVVVFFLAIATTSIAFFVGSKIKRTVGLFAISGIVSASLSLIAPTFYPYTALPAPVLYVLMVSPVTPADILLQGAYALSPQNNYMWILLIAETIFWMFIATKLSTWREK